MDLGLTDRAFLVTGGSRVVGLLPGPFTTAHVTHLTASTSDPEAALAAWSDKAALKRLGDSAEFGRVATFALSDAAPYPTGCMIPVDGGCLRGL